MGQPFFSVIIPTYNRVLFLKIAVKSVLEQTFADYELIIVDDGSGDETKEMLKKYTDEKIIYIYQEHSGVSKARNVGLKKAKGEYIAFLDSDDRYCRDKLKITYEYIKKYPDYKIFHTEEVWYRSGELLAQKEYHRKPSGFCFANAVKLCSISISTVAVKKELFDIIGVFDENLPACEDYDFWLRATAQFPVFLIPEYLTIKEGGHAGQQSKRYPAMDKFRISALKKILETGKLTEENYHSAYEELAKKIMLYIQGALKRSKTREVEEYWDLLKRLKKS